MLLQWWGQIWNKGGGDGCGGDGEDGNEKMQRQTNKEVNKGKRSRRRSYKDDDNKNGATGNRREQKLSLRVPTMILFAEEMKKIFDSAFGAQ